MPRNIPSELLTRLEKGSKSVTELIKITPRFYLGGSFYTDWASVPNRYKVDDPTRPNADRSTASVFKFGW